MTLVKIPEDMLYAVIEYEIDDILYSLPAPCNWLKEIKQLADEDGRIVKKGLCYWPVNESKLEGMLERRIKPIPNTTMWCERPAKVLVFCTAAKKRAMDLKRRRMDLQFTVKTGVDEHLGNWLKDAPKRFQNEKLKMEKQKNQMEDIDEAAEVDDVIV